MTSKIEYENVSRPIVRAVIGGGKDPIIYNKIIIEKRYGSWYLVIGDGMGKPYPVAKNFAIFPEDTAALIEVFAHIGNHTIEFKGENK